LELLRQWKGEVERMRLEAAVMMPGIRCDWMGRSNNAIQETLGIETE
jgi:hypothetical protein